MAVQQQLADVPSYLRTLKVSANGWPAIAPATDSCYTRSSVDWLMRATGVVVKRLASLQVSTSSLGSIQILPGTWIGSHQPPDGCAIYYFHCNGASNVIVVFA